MLELYALEGRTVAAQEALDRIRARLELVRRDQAAAQARLGSARRTLRISQIRLAVTLRALYVQDDIDPLAVLFGATSLDGIVTGLDNITQAARTHSFIASEARSARARITRVARSLHARVAEVARLEAEATATAESLATARRAKEEYLAGVRADQAATAEEIVAAEAAAAEARARAAALAAQPAVTSSAFASNAAAAAPQAEPVAEPEPSAGPSPPPAEPAAEPGAPVQIESAPPVEKAQEFEAAPTQAPPSGARTMTVTATAYSGGGTTATGLPVGWGVAAVDPGVIPLGTRMSIPGYGEAVAADTGSAVIGAMVDVWLPTEAQAEAWGVQSITITIH